MENILSNFFSNFFVVYGSQIKDFVSRMLFDECVTILQFMFSKLFLFINNNGLLIYSEIANRLTLAISNFKNKYNSKSLKTRCIHDIDIDPHFVHTLDHHNEVVSDIKFDDLLHIDNARIVPTTFFDITKIDESKITVNIPMIFHLIDPQLCNFEVDHWTTHINTKIISQLNTDYNRNFTNYSSEFINNINTIFCTADSEKRNYYLNLANTLPNNLNITWNFTLKSVVMKSTNNLSISDSNDSIFRSVQVEDPDSFLNIIIAPGTTILGIAVFPFSDRSSENPALIDKNLKYRNAVLISSLSFVGNKAPYDKFRTFTHEIGHWCGLLHPFDNQTYKTNDINAYGLNKIHLQNECSNDYDQDTVGDMVYDTATQIRPTFGTVYDSMINIRKMVNGSIVMTKKRNTPYAMIFENNKTTPNFLNFMDYTDDNQMCMFTFGQLVKIIYMMSRFRPNFLTVETIDKEIQEVAIEDIVVNEQTISENKFINENVIHQVANIEPVQLSDKQ